MDPLTSPAPIVAAVDAGPSHGLGHLARSSAVVLALRAEGADVECLALGAASDTSLDGVIWSRASWEQVRSFGAAGSVIVLDSYDIDPADVTALASRTPVAWFHDHEEAPPGVAIVISVGTKPPGPPTWCCGLDYACLRRDFWNAVADHVRPHARRVLVTTGGGDPGGASNGLVEAVRRALPEADTRLVLGPHATGPVPAGVELVTGRDSLFEELRGTDLVVCGAGQTALEAISLGIPAVVVVLAPNQADAARRLEEAKVARVVWPRTDPLPDVRELGINAAMRADLTERGPRTIDGRGAARVAGKIKALITGSP